jgi:Fe-S-cluster containining protein
MSPEEVAAAADYVNLTAPEFIETYAESKLDSPTKQDDIPWILVKNQETEGEKGCVFLDNETNFCKIYPVRPIQCSTYPFWTNIIESEYHWNTEVRRADDDLSSSLPAWSAEDGGCEGMKILDEENTSSNTEDGVAMEEALEQLSLYQRTDRRLPREGDFEPI